MLLIKGPGNHLMSSSHASKSNKTPVRSRCRGYCLDAVVHSNFLAAKLTYEAYATMFAVVHSNVSAAKLAYEVLTPNGLPIFLDLLA